MAWSVVAGQVTAETDVGPGRARVDFGRGEVLPADVPPEDIERLAALGAIAEHGPPADPDDDGEPEDDEVPDGTIAVVLEWVGDSPERASEALSAEQLKGDKARLTLIGELERILNA